MHKVAENEARHGTVRVIIENGYSVTVKRREDSVALSSEIIVDAEGYSDGSIVDLSLAYEWASGEVVTDEDKVFLREELAKASNVLDAGFRFKTDSG